MLSSGDISGMAQSRDLVMDLIINESKTKWWKNRWSSHRIAYSLDQLNAELRHRLPTKPRISSNVIANTSHARLVILKLTRDLTAEQNLEEVTKAVFDYGWNKAKGDLLEGRIIWSKFFTYIRRCKRYRFVITSSCNQAKWLRGFKAFIEVYSA